MVKLKECLQRIDSGKSIVCESHPRSGDFPAILKLSAVTYGEFIPEENKQLPSKELYIPSLEVKTGDLLFSRKNTLEYVGMTVLVKETPVNLMLPELIFRLVPNETITPLYLHQLINHPQFRSTISNLASGSAGSMPNISKQKLFDLEIPLPPLGMQKSLCPLIQQTDKSKFELKQNIENINSLMRSLMRQDFTN
jgi:type I restriction enzyme S subunit